MRIVFDRYIPGIVDRLGDVVDLVPCEPGAIRREILRDCDALLVRTVTRVDAELLKGTPVRFVATATSGSDHVDTAYLSGRGIGFAAAGGSNARPVAEYVLCALVLWCEQRDLRLTNQTVGIIGCGHVGSMLAGLLEVLGVTVLLNDPPLAEQGDPRRFHDLDTVLNADVVSLHVPLHAGGRHPTVNLVDRSRLRQLGPGTLLINTARGGVVDEAALKNRIHGQGMHAVIDVWQGEPAIDAELASSVLLGTPHIAGYSLAAKHRASAMVCRAIGDYFDVPVSDRPGPATIAEEIGLVLSADEFESQLRRAMLYSYDPRDDAGRLQQTLNLPAAERPAAFTALRHGYRLRPEFSSLTLELRGPAAGWAGRFAGLGFRVRTRQPGASATGMDMQ